MALNYKVKVLVDGMMSGQVVVGNMKHMLYLVSENTKKGRKVEVHPTNDQPTHRNTAYAQACIEMYQMGLPLNDPDDKRIIDVHA